MRLKLAGVLAHLTVAVGALTPSAAHAACTLPNTLTNGQPADANEVMANFSAVTTCMVSNGTVNSGTAGQVGTYSSTGNAISGQSLSSVLDSSVGTTQGSILFRGSSGWQALGPGTAGLVLSTNGTGANPSWIAAGGAGGGILPFNPPSAATFPTLINAGSGSPAPSLTQTANGLLFNAGAFTSGDHVRAYLKNTVSASTFTATWGLIGTQAALNYRSWGAVITDGTKYYLFQVLYDGQMKLNVTRMQNATTYDSNQATITSYWPMPQFFQIKADGTNLYFNTSSDGYTFVTLYKESLGAYLGTITQYGIGGDANANVAVPSGGLDQISAQCFYFVESTP